MTVDPKEVTIPVLHGHLLGAIGPRPIALASTIDKSGRPNLAPFSFFNVFSANPPIAIFSPARRGRDNTTKHTFHNVKDTGEVVINVVNYDIVQQVSLASTEYPDGVNEFDKAGLTALASERVKPFRVAESPVSLECKVKEVIELGDQGGAGNLVISEVVLVHINDDLIGEDGRIDQQKIDLVGRMGGNWYCRAHGDAMFEVQKPLTSMGIGVDSIPTEIRKSNILTGNDLGRLGNVEDLPDETTVNEYKLTDLSELFIRYESDAKTLETELHKLAHAHLENGNVDEAWLTLLAFNN